MFGEFCSFFYCFGGVGFEVEEAGFKMGNACFGANKRMKPAEPSKVVPYSEIEQSMGFNADHGKGLEYGIQNVHGKVLAEVEEKELEEQRRLAEEAALNAKMREAAEKEQGEEETEDDKKEAEKKEEVFVPAAVVPASALASKFEKGNVGQTVIKKEEVKIKRTGIAEAVKTDRKANAYVASLANHV